MLRHQGVVLKVILVAVASLLLVGIFFFVGGNFSSPKISDASDFVESMKLGNNFYDISYRAGQITTTYQGMVKKVGQSEAKALLRKHLRDSINRRQLEWNSNLTKSYLRYFTEKELVSIANERDNSEFAPKFEKKRGDVGKYMQSISTQLVKDVLEEALKNAYKEVNASNT